MPFPEIITQKLVGEFQGDFLAFFAFLNLAQNYFSKDTRLFRN